MLKRALSSPIQRCTSGLRGLRHAMDAPNACSTVLGEVHAALFPGVPYSQGRNAVLASRLRELAGQLESDGAAEQEGAGPSPPLPAPAAGKRGEGSVP